jgi:hypothetical protein
MILPDRQMLLLILALLLSLWLLLRVRGKEEKKRPSRRTPFSANELARMVLDTVRERDIQAYRGLFLIGHEAAAIFGPKAQGYLDACNGHQLEESLDFLAKQLTPGLLFVRGDTDKEGRCYLIARNKDSKEYPIYLGQTVHIGKALRLQYPATGLFKL